MDTLIKARRRLLPWWMKFFLWIFIVIGCLTAVTIALQSIGITLFLGYPPDDTASIYGLESNDIYSPLGFLINGMLLFKGYTAYAMWTGKDRAMELGMVDAIIGLVTCIIVTVTFPFIQEGMINLRLEILFLLPYLLKCIKLKGTWKYLSSEQRPSLSDLQVDTVLSNSSNTGSDSALLEKEASEEVSKEDKEDHSRFMPKQ